MHPAEVCETLRDAEAVAILSESIGGLLQADGSFSLGKILDDNTVKLTLVCLSMQALTLAMCPLARMPF